MRIGIAGPINLKGEDFGIRHGFRSVYGFPLVKDLAEAYLARGHDIVVFALSVGVSATHTVSTADGRATICIVPRASYKRRIASLFNADIEALAAVMRSEPCDVLHAHWCYEFAEAALLVNPDAIVTVHDSPLDSFRQHRDATRAVRAVIARKVIGRARHLTSVSPWVSERIQSHFSLDVAPLVICNGVRSDLVAAPAVRTTRMITSIANGFSRRKNVAALLESFRDVVEVDANAQLRLLGHEMGLGGAAQRWAARNGCLAGVNFLGEVPSSAVREILVNSTDVYVHPSREEACSMAVLEAMAAGLPIVGGINSGGVPHQIGKSGILVDITDPNSLTAAILGILRNPDWAAKLGQLARQRAADEFNFDHMVLRYLELYEINRTAAGTLV